MSYGRYPFNIWSDGENVHFWASESSAEDKGFPGVSVPVEALAQYIASMAARGGRELNGMVQRGKYLRGDLPAALVVKVEGC